MVKSSSIKTWKSHQKELNQLKKLALSFKASFPDSDEGMELTVRAWKKPELPNTEKGRQSGDDFTALVNYHKYLVIDLGLDYHMVRSIWNDLLA